ncbi:MAG: hypothetical protein JW384_03870 [Nitrosomonadaceae bacterium]|nr:hypothetical protein [Nitrosomonadaceae bacterium]
MKAVAGVSNGITYVIVVGNDEPETIVIQRGIKHINMPLADFEQLATEIMEGKLGYCVLVNPLGRPIDEEDDDALSEE